MSPAPEEKWRDVIAHTHRRPMWGRTFSGWRLRCWKRGFRPGVRTWRRRSGNSEGKCLTDRLVPPAKVKYMNRDLAEYEWEAEEPARSLDSQEKKCVWNMRHPSPKDPRGRFPNYHGWLMSFYLMLIHVILPIKFNQIIPEKARFKGEIVSRFLCFGFLIFTKENDKCSQIITFPHRREVFLRLLWTWL